MGFVLYKNGELTALLGAIFIDETEHIDVEQIIAPDTVVAGKPASDYADGTYPITDADFEAAMPGLRKSLIDELLGVTEEDELLGFTPEGAQPGRL